ncbi:MULTISPECIES: hypothetical protein [unclassified Exiguobacterium]|uniref:hypothetical protein n=1 Tax=unclassified Exiguobacterium TaxID=2644629 RepID=UPI001BE5AC27|nr:MULTISPECIES: hypothetical protein [unclassified Exiguobacterium]
MAKKKQFVTAAAAFAVAASAVAPAITADAAMKTVRLSSDYVRVGDLDATLDKEYKGSEIYWYKSSVDLNKLGVFQTAKGFVKGQGIRVEKRVRVLNHAQEIKPESEFVFEQGVPVSGIRVQPVLFADGNEYAKPLSVAGFNTDKVGEFEGTLTYANRAYGVVTKTVKYKVVSSAPELETVKAVDVNKVEVKFNKPVDPSKATVKLTKGLANYNVTTEWNEAKDAVVITSVLSKLSPSDYTVVVEGLTEKALSADVKFEAEKANELKMTTSKVDVAGNATLHFDVLNQYGTKFTTVDPNKLTVTTTESIDEVSFSEVTEGSSTDKRGNLKGDFTITGSKLKAGDMFKVTAVYEGVVTTGDVTFVNPIGLQTLAFGSVSPLKDKTRITTGEENLVVDYTAVDQYGTAYELSNDDLNAITFVSSDSDIVNVDSLEIVDKKLTLDAGTKAGTAIITAILPNGKTAQFSVMIEAAASVKTVAISAPTKLIADGEKAELDLVVYDQFGQVIPNKDVTGVTFSNGFSINAKTGKLEGTVTANDAFKVTATKDGKELAAVTFSVEAKAVANTISAIDFESLFEVGASNEIMLDDVSVKDQYGRNIEPTTIEVTEVDATNDKFTVSGSEFTAVEAGQKVFKVAVDGSASAVKNITLTAIASKDITSYELSPLGTIYNADAYAVTPKLMGKTADGKSVVLKTGKISSLTSSNAKVAVVDGLTVKGGLASDAASATSTIKAWSADGQLLGTALVTVTNEKPSLNSIVASEEIGSDVDSVFKSKDQYGKDFAEMGTWYFTSTVEGSNTVAVTSGAKTFATDSDDFDPATGDYTVKFVSEDGLTVATTVVTVK